MAKRKTTSLLPKKPAPPPRSTLDGWENISTGLGQFGKDKTMNVQFQPELLSQEECEQFWRGDDIVATIIETVPNEMLRKGFDVTIDNDKEATDELKELLRSMDLKEKLLTALKYSRAYGGGGIFLGINDGVDPLSKSKAGAEAYRKHIVDPVDESRVQSIDFLNVMTPRELAPFEYYSDPLLPNYGEVKTYRIVPIYAPPGASAQMGNWPLVHESRVLRIPGEETTRRAMLTNVQPGWPDSILVRVLRVIANFQGGWQGVGILLQDFAFATLKIKGLAELLSMQGAKKDLTMRASAMEAARSIASTTIIDSEEEYKRETTNVAGLSDLLERLAERLAAAARMPVSLLFGQTPGGMNATGDADIRWFYDQIAAWQEKKIQKPIEYFCKLLFLAKTQSPTGGVLPDDWSVTFPALWQQTEGEAATTRKTQADADKTYIDAGVLTPEEVATSRFGGTTWQAETHLDMESRGEMGEIIDPETGERPEDPMQSAQVEAVKAKTEAMRGASEPTKEADE